MIVWALFDSGNGCYTQAAHKYFPNIEIYPIGIDIENKNNHFINLDLSDFSEIFTGTNKIFERLDQLPKPDIILASPPCESWSLATSIKNGTNYWQTNQQINTLFGAYIVPTHFTLQTRANFDKGIEKRGGHFNASWNKTIYNRVNGELCAVNTMRVIKRYNPKIWVIENPLTSKIWEYYRQIHGFNGIRNTAHYNFYDGEFLKKPTVFYSNIYLDLKTTRKRSKVIMRNKGDGRKVIYGYNNRSNIPLPLIKKILETCEDGLKNNKLLTVNGMNAVHNQLLN